MRPGARVCRSCGTERPEADLRQAIAFDFRVLPDAWECRSADDCWTAFRARTPERTHP